MQNPLILEKCPQGTASAEKKKAAFEEASSSIENDESIGFIHGFKAAKESRDVFCYIFPFFFFSCLRDSFLSFLWKSVFLHRLPIATGLLSYFFVALLGLLVQISSYDVTRASQRCRGGTAASSFCNSFTASSSKSHSISRVVLREKSLYTFPYLTMNLNCLLLDGVSLRSFPLGNGFHFSLAPAGLGLLTRATAARHQTSFWFSPRNPLLTCYYGETAAPASSLFFSHFTFLPIFRRIYC